MASDRESTTSETRAADPAYRHVLVPLDGSDLSAGALATARALARRFGASIETVSVGESSARADDLRRRAAELLATDPSDPRIHVEVGDDPAGAIHSRVDELGSCLVCMTTHGHGRLAGSIVGSVARSVFERGREPMVVVGPVAARLDSDDRSATAPLGADHLAACVDGGAASEQVLPVAAAWAHALRMALTIVTVAEPSPPPVHREGTWHRHHGPNVDADEYVRRLGERWAEAVPGLKAHVVYNPVSAADGMADYLRAHPTGLVAVTTHGRSGLKRVVFGSGAAAIVRHSTAPALVVPLSD